MGKLEFTQLLDFMLFLMHLDHNDYCHDYHFGQCDEDLETVNSPSWPPPFSGPIVIVSLGLAIYNPAKDSLWGLEQVCFSLWGLKLPIYAMEEIRLGEVLGFSWAM